MLFNIFRDLPNLTLRDVLLILCISTSAIVIYALFLHKVERTLESINTTLVILHTKEGTKILKVNVDDSNISILGVQNE